MPPGSAATLRRLGPRAVLCVVFAAALQYGVAAGLTAARIPPGSANLAWAFQARNPGMFDTLVVFAVQRQGSDLFTGVLRREEISPPDPSKSTRPDWSSGDWVIATSQFSSVTLRDLLRKTTTRTPPSWSRFAAIGTEPILDDYTDGELDSGVEVCTGWPARSASYFTWISDLHPTFKTRDAIVLCNTLGDRKRFPLVLPLTVYWPGAIINTLTYAAALFIPFELIPWTRRHLRRRAGRCPNCNYDLRATTTGACPECGAAITRRATT